MAYRRAVKREAPFASTHQLGDAGRPRHRRQQASVADPTTPDELERRVSARMWTPRYRPLKRRVG